MAIFLGHSEAVHVETCSPIMAAVARTLFAEVLGVVVADEPAAHLYPLASQVAGHDEIYVGRVRADPSIPGGRDPAFWCVSDNLRKGAATNAVELAELLVANGWLATASRRTQSARRRSPGKRPDPDRRGAQPPVRPSVLPRAAAWRLDDLGG